MFLSTGYIIAGLVLLYAGAEGLVRGSSSLALRMGITRLVVGLTVVALGTSSPELVVGIKAALEGGADIAVGNVVGSNIMNVALILGIAALIYPLKKTNDLIRVQIPVMIGVSVILLMMLADGSLDRWEGTLLVLGIICYTVFSIAQAKTSDNTKTLGGEEPYVPKGQRSLLRDVMFVLSGGLLLVWGGNLFVTGAVAVAHVLGMSQAVIGLTIVAIGTSLPELATSVVASFKKENDISVGNIVGSNIFNILAILGIVSLISPLITETIRPFDLAVMLATAVLVFVLAISGRRLNRWEGGILVIIYVAYVSFRVVM
ncbi:MAG: calcium/sodium antiporter [Deltaproteobacteria bacterium]|nr:calcium/sodium antiporter [Candidatus Zymogenaceae bacterium]